jgi:hypothetical protein
MTRFEIDVEEIVVRGLPAAQVPDDLGRLVEARLAQLARGEEPQGTTAGSAALAELVADGVWAEVRRAAPVLGHGS